MTELISRQVREYFEKCGSTCNNRHRNAMGKAIKSMEMAKENLEDTAINIEFVASLGRSPKNNCFFGTLPKVLRCVSHSVLHEDRTFRTVKIIVGQLEFEELDGRQKENVPITDAGHLSTRMKIFLQ